MAEKFFSAKILFSTAIPWAQKFILRVGEDIILPRRSEATRKAPSAHYASQKVGKLSPQVTEGARVQTIYAQNPVFE